ncbi:WD40 repeat [Nitrosomonas aestuarii]|uniref:WD40 repeat n=1 Tax=Nitrosomonas aestuarii TaxID=52441 RepID=A0A1I3YVB7_9PROT|nr:WD40 repeat domain-containing protein [Nitrosomonas aestuarii]SFK35161.1 WD40 repeat [Nitrosomonas aestuarii]
MTVDPLPTASARFAEQSAQQETVHLNAQHPWPGLAPYDEASSAYFFGRSEEARELLRMVRLAPLTVLYSKSGLGKTSLLQAGFFPLLRAKHYFPVHLRLDYSPAATLPPLEQAARILRTALETAHADFTPWNKDESLWQYLHKRDLEIWSHDNYPLIPVLVFDQFEEIFSRGEGNTGRIQSNLNNLADLIENRIPSELAVYFTNRHKILSLDLTSQRYRVLLAFREDFLPEMETWKEQVPSLFRNRLRLLPMNRERAIESVSHAGAAVLAPGVAEPLVNFVGNLDPNATGTTSVIEPVLLSLCCYQLNQRRLPAGKIDVSLLHQAGQDILQDFYDEALSGMPDQVSEFIETYLIQGDQYRGSYPVDQAIQDGFITRVQLSILADKYRLLRIDQQFGTNRIELIHDRLVNVVSKARDERLRQIENKKLRAQEQARQRQLAFENLNRLARKLRAALLLAVCLAGIAVYGWYTANVAKEKTFLAQSSLRVVSESLDMANGTRVGGDERAILQLLAINQITPSEAVDSAILTVLSNKNATQKIWSTGDRITSVAVNQQATLIATAGMGNTLRLWNFQGQLINQQVQAHQCAHEGEPNRRCGILNVSFSPDGAHIVTSGQDATLRLWHTSTLKFIGKLQGHSDQVTSATFSPDGEHIVSGSLDKTLRLWSTNTLKSVAILEGHMDGVTSVVFSPDGTRIVSGSHDNTLRLWDAKTLASIHEPLQGHKDSITRIDYSSDGLMIASSSQDKTLRLWNAQTLKALGEPLRGHDDIVWNVAFSPDNTRIVTAAHDRTLRLWKTENGQPIGKPIQGHEESVMAVAFSPDGKYFVSGGRDNTLRIWDANDHQPIHSQLKGGHKNFVASVAYSPDGKLIVSGSDDATVQLWDAESGNTAGKPMKNHTGSLNGVAFSPDGKWIVSGASDQLLCLWDTASQTLMDVMTGHEDGIESVAFSPNGKFIASGSKDNTVRLWNRKSGRLIHRPMTAHDKMVRGVAFSRDGELIASASYDGTVRLWHVRSGRSIAELTGHEAAVTSVAFSPDNNHLVSGSKDHTLILWDLNTHQSVGEPMAGHTDRVNSVAFSPDGKQIISGSSDHTLRLWNRKTGQAIGGPMRGHEKRVNSVAYHPDGTRIVSGSDDMTLRIWPAHNNWVEQLCNKLTRNMTEKEWHEWISSEIEYQKQCPDLPVAS